MKFEDQKMTTFVSILYMYVKDIIRWIFTSKFGRVLRTS